MIGTALTVANHNNMHLCTFVSTCLCIFAVVATNTVTDLRTLHDILKLFLQTASACMIRAEGCSANDTFTCLPERPVSKQQHLHLWCWLGQPQVSLATTPRLSAYLSCWAAFLLQRVPHTALCLVGLSQHTGTVPLGMSGSGRKGWESYYQLSNVIQIFPEAVADF